MDRVINCFLLGAGASRDAHLPTSEELWADFKAKASHSMRRRLDSLEKAVKIEEDSKSKATPGKNRADPNIEKIATKVRGDDISLFDKLRGFTIKRVQSPKHFEYLRSVYSFDYDWTWGNARTGTPVWKLVPEDRQFMLNCSTRVFTLNYDTTVERALGLYDPYLGLFEWVSESDELVLAEDIRFNDHRGVFEKSEDPNKPPRDTRGVFKLHGSINWVRRKVGEMEKLFVSNHSARGHCEIIFGTDEKLRMTEPYEKLFPVFSISLQKCSVLFVVGYSFGDRHINEVIGEQVGHGMRVVCINPNPNVEGAKVHMPLEKIVFVREGTKKAFSRAAVSCSLGLKGKKNIRGGLRGVYAKVVQPMLRRTR